jgi:hypothetical protein
MIMRATSESRFSRIGRCRLVDVASRGSAVWAHGPAHGLTIGSLSAGPNKLNGNLFCDSTAKCTQQESGLVQDKIGETGYFRVGSKLVISRLAAETFISRSVNNASPWCDEGKALNGPNMAAILDFAHAREHCSAWLAAARQGTRRGHKPDSPRRSPMLTPAVDPCAS